MKDDFLEYLFLSNVLVKFKQKYVSMVGPLDLTSGFGSFPLVLLKSLSMIDALTYQINIKYILFKLATVPSQYMLKIKYQIIYYSF